MDDITPDLIARMASRIYNEAPTKELPIEPPSGIPSMHSQAMPSSAAPAHPPFAHAAPVALSPAVPPAAPYSLPGTQPLPNPHATNHSLPSNHSLSTGHAPMVPLTPTPSHYMGSQSSLPTAHTPSPTHFASHDSFSRDSRSPLGTTTDTRSGDQQRTSDGLRAFVSSLRQPFGTSTSSGNVHADQSNLKHTFAIPRPATQSHTSRPLDVPAIREDFPILRQQIHGRPLAWFDNAATTQKPQSVIDAISRFYERDNSNIHRGAHTLAARATDAYEQAREKVQHFLGAGSINEIVFVRGTTEGINLIAQTYGRKFLQPGDEIVLSMLEHHANIVPWQMVAKEKGLCYA